MTPETEKPLHTTRTNSGSMWCEMCERATVATSTTTRFYRNGIQVERQKCLECKNVQETEYFKGSTTRIKNKK